MTSLGDTLRFQHPPVRAVALTVYFRPIQGLLVTALTSLVASIKKDFPVVTERFSEMPWLLEDEETEEEFEYPDADVLPFPYLSFDNGSGQSIHFQDDRFRIRWTFSEGADYPGFEELRAQLSKHFVDYESHIFEQTGSGISISHVRVQYDNDISPATPLHVAARAYGVEVDFSSADTTFGDVTEPVFHGTFNFPRDDGVAEVVMFAGKRGETDCVLGLRAASRLAEAGSSGWTNLLDEAHSNLIDTFSRLTSSEQKQSWGVLA